MINIAILDDDNNICVKLENILIEYLKKYHLKFNVDVFYNGQEFIKYLKNENIYDIIFLDIEIGNLTGVDVGKYIRKKLNNKYSKIIYISSFNKYAMDLFDLKPTNFLIKPLNKNKIIEVVKDILNDIDLQENEFVFKVKYDTFRIRYKNILYFESVKLSKNIKIVTIDNTYIFRETLNNIEEIVKKNNFIKISKSILVNFHNITVFKPVELEMILINNDVLPLSKNRINSIKGTYFDLLDERYY
ncbi:LytTR family DNA-binding domain-containing protein [uncultured Tyzzerella sp.]|uniref:LytR/AlgR family response regulator transcription factor n=1 Tax=uncultured Tyzzerella sp. TaxID=2321398 RepID=UPI00294306E5|nr:LytTR family DNA-binding domain-containing protein [uncultured Tyzzerella sp.]